MKGKARLNPSRNYVQPVLLQLQLQVWAKPCRFWAAGLFLWLDFAGVRGWYPTPEDRQMEIIMHIVPTIAYGLLALYYLVKLLGGL